MPLLGWDMLGTVTCEGNTGALGMSWSTRQLAFITQGVVVMLHQPTAEAALAAVADARALEDATGASSVPEKQ